MSEEHKHTHENPEKGLLSCGAALLSCEEYSKLASKKLDAKLTLWESFAYRFHHLMCMVCRRFNRQIIAINTAASRYQDSSHDTATHVALSEDSKDRMRGALSKALKD